MAYKKLSVAIEALAYIAMNSGEHPASSKQICHELGLKLRYTETLMQAFVKAGILKSVRGIAGGYSLGRERRKINLSEVYNIVKSMQSKEPAQKASPLSALSEEVINDVEHSLNNTLSRLTLEEIYDKAIKLKMSSGQGKKSDFVI